MTRRRAPLERSIEGAATRHANELGFLHRKMNGAGFRSWPDRMFIGPGAVFFIEFKRRGLPPTPQQAWLHEILRAAGHRVHVCDSTHAARVALRYEMQRIGRARLLAWHERLSRAPLEIVAALSQRRGA